MRVLLLLAALAAPAPATAAPEDGDNARTPRGERRVCRDVAPSMTRLRGQRVCMTQREWDRLRDDGVDALGEFQGRPDPNAARRANIPR